MNRLIARGLAPLVVAIVAGLVAPLASPGSADAGEFAVVHCAKLNRGHDGARTEERGDAQYNVVFRCDDRSNENAIKIASVNPAQRGRRGRVYWEAPAGTRIVRVAVQAKLRRDQGHAARLYMSDQLGRESARFAVGRTGGTTFQRYAWRASGPGQRQFSAALICTRTRCPRSDRAKTWVRDVRLTLRDSLPPSLSLDGTLLAAGWMRGAKELRVNSTDQGGGIRRVEAAVNGVVVAARVPACDQIPGTDLFRSLRPCPAGQDLALGTDTAAQPFHDGANQLRVCARDVGTPPGVSCADRTVRVDNSAPALAFRDAQDPGDPELIRAPVADPHSGVQRGEIYFRQKGSTFWHPVEARVDSGELRARVDSAAELPGEYEFFAKAWDAVGNESSTTRREDGEPMVLSFPLRAATRIRAHLKPGGASRMTVPYGGEAKVSGRLITAAGKPIAGAPVVVTQRFGPGSLIDRRERTVTTDRRGYFGSLLPRGPSRRVSVSYAGSRRYLASERGRIAFRVRGKARLRTSKRRVLERRRVVFRGRVPHRGARIPDGGKLFELQFKRGPRQWDTVGQARFTKPDGSFRIPYRFRGNYHRDVPFIFRVRVMKERRVWPYLRGRSASRKVTVVARDE